MKHAQRGNNHCIGKNYTLKPITLFTGVIVVLSAMNWTVRFPYLYLTDREHLNHQKARVRISLYMGLLWTNSVLMGV